jgi:hypothetical protein
MTPSRRGQLLLLLVIGAPACGGFNSDRDALQEAVRSYNDNLRWERYREASTALPADRREGWVRSMERAGRTIRVVDYEITPVEVAETQAIVIVDLTYYRQPAVTLVQSRRMQTWRHAEGRWHLEADEEAPLEEEPPPTTLPELAPLPPPAPSH